MGQFIIQVAFICLIGISIQNLNVVQSQELTTINVTQKIISTTRTTRRTWTTATTTFKATESNEKAYEVLKKPVEIQNSKIDPDSSVHRNQTIQTNINNTVIVPSVQNEGARWAFHRFLDKFDRYTLIMITAFVVGLFLIFLLVAVVLCICKNFNEKQPDLETSNPMYNSDYGKPNEKQNGTSNKQNKTLDFLEDEDEKVELLLKTKNDIEMKPLNSPDTASLSSVDSKVIKSPSSPSDFAGSPNVQQQSEVMTTRSGSAYTPIKQTDNEPSPPSSSKYVPSYVQKLKTSSQINKEGQTSASRRSLNRKSECFDDKNSTSSHRLNKQQSTTTSNSSIPNVAVDFGTVKGHIDDMFNNKTSRGSLNSVSHPSLADPKSTHVSAANIYMEAYAERMPGVIKTKMPRQISNLSTTSTSSSEVSRTSSKKSSPKPVPASAGEINIGRSLGALNITHGVNIDPGGGTAGVNNAAGRTTSASRRSLAQSRTDSVNTLESEKSCY